MTTLSAPIAGVERPRATSPPPRPLPLGALFGAIAASGCLAVGLLGLDQMPVSLCLFKMTTGLPCPTCAATRAFGRLFHADLPGAFAMNPLVVALTLAFLPWAALDLWRLPHGRAKLSGI